MTELRQNQVIAEELSKRLKKPVQAVLSITDEIIALNGGTWKGVWKGGKKKAGRLLDGREWNEMPNVAVAV